MSQSTEFQSQFHATPDIVAQLGDYGLTDSSWGNDTSPSFSNDLIQVFVQPEDVDLRECGGDRFVVTVADQDSHLYAETLFTCETLAELKAFLDKRSAYLKTATVVK